MPSSAALSFSHVGLYVLDLERMVDFYTRVLGFVVTDRGTLGTRKLAFLSRDPREHHQVVFATGRHPDLSVAVVNQLSFRVPDLGELKDFAASLEGEPVSELDPTVHGNAWSLYFRDPEGNRLEVFTDSDWYISQPIKEKLDLTLSEEEIRRQTLAFCQDRPGFEPIDQWRTRLAAKMEQAMAARRAAATR